jgi:hypothetical protein
LCVCANDSNSEDWFVTSNSGKMAVSAWATTKARMNAVGESGLRLSMVDLDSVGKERRYTTNKWVLIVVLGIRGEMEPFKKNKDPLDSVRVYRV